MSRSDGGGIGCLPTIALALILAFVVMPIMDWWGDRRDKVLVDAALANMVVDIEMPALVGESAGDAEARLRDLTRAAGDFRDLDLPLSMSDEQDARAAALYEGRGGDWTKAATLDASPLARQTSRRWTVIATVPGAGQSLERGVVPTLFVLQESEVAWFTSNPVMPHLPSGVDVKDLTDTSDGILAPVADLVERRWYDAAVYEGARSLIHYDDDRGESLIAQAAGKNKFLGEEADWEREAREAFVEAEWNHASLNMETSVPGEGTPLRLGQVLTVLVSERPRELARGDSPVEGGSLGVEGRASAGGGGDGDLGKWGKSRWCPTRWC